MKVIHISLFTGIAGFDLAASWAGWETGMTCEVDDFCNTVIEYWFPEAYHHRDIKTLTNDTIDAELTKRFGDWRKYTIVLSGGFPCQPYSLAGLRKGKEDSRHLWPEMYRIIQFIKPSWVVGENVNGLINWNGGLVFDEVQADLEAEGYEIQPILLPAAGVNAPHRRDRIWFVAYSNKNQRGERWSDCFREIKDKTFGSDLFFESERLAEIWTSPNTNKFDGDLSRFSASEVPQYEKAGLFQDIDSNTLRAGLQEHDIAQKSNRQELCSGVCFENVPDWSNFPTQSPICNRNDGVSLGLADITFSKWRIEALKALGNAVVPQVPYQIFKVINIIYASRIHNP